MNNPFEDPFVLLPLQEGLDKSSPFANCIRNNYRHLRKWAKRSLTDSFRIYDRELHHYPLAIDYYAGRFCIHYYSQSRDEEAAPEALRAEVEQTLSNLFDITGEAIFWRTRMRSKATRQYEKMDESRTFFTVHEYGVKFRVNLTDYLDTGLFLDHRETRRHVAQACNGKRLLNLFAYTCAFSVQAAAHGAVFTKSVDMSNTYTRWGRANFAINGFRASDHEIVRADCLKFLDDALFVGEKYDVIIVDPPTISRSKKMEGLFDIQADYIPLLKKCLKLLNPKGQLFFSTNSRKFAFDVERFHDVTVREISHKTLPQDFRDPKIHRCWILSTSP